MIINAHQFGIPAVLTDTFTGATLDTGKWGTYRKGAGSAIVQNDDVLLTGTNATASAAAIYSVSAIPRTGTVTIQLDWKPGTVYSGTGGQSPYLSIRVTNPTRDASYGYPTSGLQLVLANSGYGGSGSTTVRANMRCGVFVAAQNIANSITVNYPYNVWYRFIWTINWTSQQFSLTVDGVQKYNAVSFSYSPATDVFLELGYANYGINGERFDNVIVTAV